MLAKYGHDLVIVGSMAAVVLINYPLFMTLIEANMLPYLYT